MAAPNSRSTLIDHCLRRLGEPVIEVNVDPDQLEDRLDEALQYYQEFHADATVKTYIKHQVTAANVTNEYIDIPSSVIFVKRLFPVSTSFNNAINFFDIKYQMMLNDIADLQNFAGDLAYYDQMQQYLSLLDMKLNGTPQVNFSRRQGRLYIHGDFEDKDIKEDDYIIVEALQIVDPNSHTSVYNDMFIKDYTTALFKLQWGQNLIKFEGMQLPGGVTINGRQLYEDAMADIEKLQERIRLEQELPVDFFIG
jgi:hypothetical protein